MNSSDDFCIADYARIIGETDEEHISKGSYVCYNLVNE